MGRTTDYLKWHVAFKRTIHASHLSVRRGLSRRRKRSTMIVRRMLILCRLSPAAVRLAGQQLAMLANQNAYRIRLTLAARSG